VSQPRNAVVTHSLAGKNKPGLNYNAVNPFVPAFTPSRRDVKPTSYIADFDSAAAMLRALANDLHGRDFPLLGTMPRSRLEG
jgi:hypothetical protein